MITVEELIVQSLYHRLVLVRVRRTTELLANCDDSDNVGAGVLQTVESQSPRTNEAAASSDGLGNI